MSVIGNALLLGGGDAAFTTERSVRLRSSASAYFNRTFGTATNASKWTKSFWVKRGTFGSVPIIAAQTVSASANYAIQFNADSTLTWQFSNTLFLTTTQVFRDPSAWYHIVMVWDAANATAANRAILYINGVQVTTFVTDNRASVSASQNAWETAGTGYISYNNGTNSFDGYLAEINFVDGQALTPSAFGEYDSVRNTQWKPKAYSGSWGTNGFYLKFANPASIGLDSSGNGNNWTATGIQTSNSALTTYDSMLDVPTLTSESASNFCTLNPLASNTSTTPTQGNLYLGTNGPNNFACVATMGVSSGKWYWEVKPDSGFTQIGVTSLSSLPANIGLQQATTFGKCYYGGNGNKYDNGTQTAYGATFSSADLMGIALDMDAGTLTFYKNNVSQGTAFTGLSGVYFPAMGASNTYNAGYPNFGQRPFTYTPPTGFKSLNTYNLPDPAITSSDDYHKVYTYTGNGGGLQVGEIQKPLSLYNLDRSIRFKGTNSYFDKVFASGGANTKGTFSFWVKRGKLAVQQELIRFGTTGTLFSGLLFNASDQLAFLRLNSTYQVNLVTTRVFRDPNAWYHIVVAWDSTLGPSSNSVKIYINGIQETVFTSSTYPSASLDMYFFTAGTHNIGRYPVGGNYFGGYMAEFHAVDGQQLTPDSFGQFDGNYYWTPKDYTGGYGTNGWHLDFEDYSSMSATGIGKDVSGLGNNFTPYNFNVTTPANTNADWDSMVDVPTLTSTDVANFCTLSPLRSFVSGSAATFTDGNLAVSIPAVLNPPRNVTSTYDVFSGKWYWEVIAGTVASNFVIGIASKAMDFNATIFTTGSYLYDATNGNKYIGGTASAYGASYTTNDVIGIALDMDAGTLTFYKNGVSQGVAVTGLQGLTVTPVIAASGSSAITGTFNFGQRPFRYSNYGTDRPDATFKPINSYNIAEVTGDLESPDFVWIKSRSAGTEHALFNSVVGTGKYLRSSNTAIEATDVNSLIQFNKNGFLLGNAAIVNASAATFVASAWKVAANNQNIAVGQYGTTPANVPSIASTVRANPTAGVSVVTYTGNQTAGATVGHGLGVAPSLIIAKTRTAVTSWAVYHKSLGATSWLMLNSTLLRTVSAQEWNNTEPTTTVFTVGNSSSNSNQAATTVAYCFAEIAGFSKFTSYLANASSTGDGPFVACGFAPRWIMIKRATGASGSGGWIMYDTARSTYNTMSEYLFAEGAAGANTLAAIDVTANGFKIKTNNVHLNQTANDIYIVMAFAEHPFKYSLAR